MFDANDIAERLERRFGLGANPTARKALYARLAALVEEKGEIAYHTIREVAADAAAAERPDRFFCKIVLLRLIERHILKAPEL